jgi:flagellar basal-body rod protein FlgB
MFRQVDLMQRGMDAAWMRQDVISHNIANADTPNYKAQGVRFETMMKAALEGKGKMEGVTTHEKHFPIGGVPDPTKVRPVTVRHNHFTVRMDGNNVDMDHEMSELAANYIRYSMLQAQASGSLNRLKMAIREAK